MIHLAHNGGKLLSAATFVNAKNLCQSEFSKERFVNTHHMLHHSSTDTCNWTWNGIHFKIFRNEFSIDCQLIACTRDGAINFNLSFHDYWILDEFQFIRNDSNNISRIMIPMTWKMLAVCSIKQFHSVPTSLKSLYPFRSLSDGLEWTFISRCTFLCKAA